MNLALLSSLALLAQAAPAAAPPLVVLACDIPAAPSAAVVTSRPTRRTFQVGPGTLKEWNLTDRAFGRNLCKDYTCTKTPDRAEGTLSSASVAYTIGINYGSRTGYWKAVGASGLGANQGACQVVAAPPKAKP